jgi:hypothetical protein
MLRFPHFERGFQAALADVAPGADKVEYDVYAQRLARVDLQFYSHSSESKPHVISWQSGAHLQRHGNLQR